MKPPFFTQKPYAIPSMNRVRIVDLPGLNLPDVCQGKLAFHLCLGNYSFKELCAFASLRESRLLSTENLRKMVVSHIDVLQLDANSPDLLRAFDGCFTAVSTLYDRKAAIRTTAEQIAREYGRYLAYLLLTLKRGDAINRNARPDWRDIHWEFWAQIEQVYVGGGLLAGHLGSFYCGS